MSRSPWAWALQALLLVVVAWQLLGFASVAASRNLEFDGGMNLEVARSISEGEGPRGAYHVGRFYPTGVQSKEPFYFVGAAVFEAFGVGPVQAQVPNLLFVLALTVLVVCAVARAMDLTAGLLAAAFVLSLPRMTFYGMMGYGEVATFCFGLGALAVLAWPTRLDVRGWKRPFFAGMLAALALATKAVGIVQVAAIAGLLVVRVGVDADRGGLLRAWVRAGLAFAGGFAVPLLLIEAWRVHWLGWRGFLDWWELQVTRIGMQSGATRSTQMQGLPKVVARLHTLATELRRERLVGIALLTLPLLSAAWFLVRRMPRPSDADAPRAWLTVGLALVAGAYVPWWLTTVPDDKAWVRYLLIGLMALAILAAMGTAWHVRRAIGRGTGPVARIGHGALAAALLAIFAPFAWTSMSKELDFSAGVDVQAVQHAARLVDALPEDRIVFGYGWYAAPVIQLYAERGFKDLTDWPIGRVTSRPAYLVADMHTFVVGFIEPVLARYPHRLLMRENAYAQVYEIDFANPHDPFARMDKSKVLGRVDFAKVDYPLTSGYEPYDPMGGRMASTDSEVLLRYSGEPALMFSAYMALQRFYLRPEPLRGRVVVEGCPPQPFEFAGTGWQAFRVALPCRPATNANLRVRILLDNSFNLPDENVRQFGFLVREIGFTE